MPGAKATMGLTLALLSQIESAAASGERVIEIGTQDVDVEGARRPVIPR